MGSKSFTERETKILEAAAQAFMRYGVKRTSMGDIAEEAGVARQTLYNVYGTKDEIFSATLDFFHHKTMIALLEALKATDTLREQMDLVLELTIVAPFRQLRALPHMEEFDEGFNTMGKGAIERSQAGVCELIADLLRPYAQQLSNAGMDPKGLADFLVPAAKGAKATAKDEVHLNALLDNMKALVLSAVGEETQAQ